MTDDIRTELECISRAQHELPERRQDAVQRAREAGITWREIARILDMTEHGLIKAAKKPR